MSEKLIKISNGADIASITAHIFCCGLPAIVTALSVISTLSLSGTALMHSIYDWSTTIHLYAFIFSSLMVVIALGAFLVAKEKDCVVEGHCAHEPCAPKKRKNWKLLSVSLALYALNVLVFLYLDTMLDFLGLEHSHLHDQCPDCPESHDHDHDNSH